MADINPDLIELLLAKIQVLEEKVAHLQSIEQSSGAISTAYPTFLLTRRTPSLNAGANALRLVTLSTNSPAAQGLGGGIRFAVGDAVYSPIDIVNLFGERDTANNSGRFGFDLALAGVFDRHFQMNANGTNSLMESDLADGTLDIGAGGAFHTAPGWMTMREITTPGNAPTNKGRILLRDNGAGKTQFCVIFQSGAVQVIATEP